MRKPTHEETIEFSHACYQRLLDPDHDNGRNMITHEKSRRVVEAMRENGWLIESVLPGSSSWVAPSGLRLTLCAGNRNNPNPTFMDGKGRDLSYRAAEKYVTLSTRQT